MKKLPEIQKQQRAWPCLTTQKGSMGNASALSAANELDQNIICDTVHCRINRRGDAQRWNKPEK